jgi:hypothetical protein
MFLGNGVFMGAPPPFNECFNFVGIRLVLEGIRKEHRHKHESEI